MSGQPEATPRSYMSVDDADAYFADTLQGMSWPDYSDQDKQRALNSATDTIDNLAYYGTALTEAHAFPRSNELEVPSRVKRACAEEAMALLKGVDPVTEAESVRRKSHGIASVRTSFDTDIVLTNYQAGFASRLAFELVKCYLADPSEIYFDRV